MPPKTAMGDLAEGRNKNMVFEQIVNYIYVCFVALFFFVCVCVCPPLDKGSSTTTLSMLFNYLGQPPDIGRGVEQACRAPLNKALCSALRISARTLADVPARSFTSCDSTFPLFDSWSFMFPPPNLSFAADLSRQFTTADMQPSQAKQSMFKHFQVVGLFAMLFYRLPSQRGNCVN